MSTDIWIGHCYDILYVNQFSLGDAEAYPLPSGAERTGTKEGSAFKIDASNKENWVNEVELAHTLQTSRSNTIRSSHDYETKLRVSVKAGASYLVYGGSLSTEVNSRVKNSLSERKTTTLTNSVRLVKKVTLLHEESATPPPLHSDFESSLWVAVTGEQSHFDTFISKYGTHFSTTVTLGGVGRQSFEFSSNSVAKLSELGVDISAQASGVIKFVEVNGSLENAVGINEGFLQEVESQDITIETLGGEPKAKFEDWLETVDSNPVPIEVDLLDHSFFIKSSFYPDKATSEISAGLELFRQRLNTYITSNGRNLGDSIIMDGDQVCLCALSDAVGNDLPSMLAQLNNPASTQSVLSNLGPTVSVTEFMSSYKTNPIYTPYVWTIQHSGGSDSGQPFNLAQLIELTNLSTGKKLDGEGANPHHGWVSASGDNAPLGTSPKTSDVWRLKNRLGYFEEELTTPINSGDVVTFHRVYVDTSKGDPAGYLQVRENKAYSTGQLYGSDKLVESGIAFQIFKLNTSN